MRGCDPWPGRNGAEPNRYRLAGLGGATESVHELGMGTGHRHLDRIFDAWSSLAAAEF